MKIKPLLHTLTFCALSQSLAATAAAPITQELWLQAQNPLPSARLGAATFIPLTLLQPLLKGKLDRPLLTEINQQAIANQLLDTNNDGQPDSLLVMADYAANASVRIHISLPAYGQLALQYPPLTQTEMAQRFGGKPSSEGVYSGGNYYPVRQMTLPPTHKIGDKLFKYEGFGWESDRIAYRFYFDERGLVDIFGKCIPDLVLARVGLDKGDYHSLSDWGMDVLKVGPSLGMGGAAAWREGKVLHPAPTTQSVQLRSGPLESSASLSQAGWMLDNKPLEFKRRFSIQAHSHLTHTQVNTDRPLGELAIGIVKHHVEKLEYLKADSEWNYLATFGQQSLGNDRLGMMLFFRHKDLVQTTQDEFNELAILKMKQQQDYYFGARWEGETPTPLTSTAFLAFLERTRTELNHPINVSLAK
jgi:hypothetical protein